MGESTKSPSSASKYYGILEIPKSASLKDICKAYKHLVKKWHPDRNKSNQAEAVDKFRSINEAYRVLSKKKREEADLFKSDTAKTPKKSSKDEEDELQISSPTLLSRTTSRISPTVDFYTSMPACFTMSGTNTPTTPVSDQPPNNLSKVASKPIIFSQSTSRRKTQPIEKKLECTLEELCNGCVKKVIITRDVVATTGLIVKEEEVVTIMVKPGWKRGTKITFEGKGDERTGDIIFSIDEKTHPLYKREGDDLLLGVEVPLVQALTGCTITIPLLGRDEAMTMSFDDEIIYPGFEKVIPGQGMPKSKQESTNRGNLVLQFLIQFPLELSEEQRSEVVSILENHNS